MTVEQHPIPSSNFSPGRAGHSIDKIVLHTMTCWIGQADARFQRVNPPDPVSAHFGVRVDGTLWQWVQVWDTAYHAGQLDVNFDSIGIEHEDGGDYNGIRPAALYERSAALVAQSCRENNIPCQRGTGGPGIYDHRQIKQLFAGTATACPDALDTDLIIRMAAAQLAPVLAPPAPVTTTTADVSVRLTVNAPVDVVHEWARIYAYEGPAAGIRPEVALAQALHETSRFAFGGTAQASWNNPAGLGVTGAPGVGNVFPTKRAGVIAHLQHLLMYFTAAHTDYCVPVIDQRHYAHRGYGNDVHQLDGHWAVPGVGYGDAILSLLPEAKKILGEATA